jgi:hypothetical protein
MLSWNILGMPWLGSWQMIGCLPCMLQILYKLTFHLPALVYWLVYFLCTCLFTSCVLACLLLVYLLEALVVLLAQALLEKCCWWSSSGMLRMASGWSGVLLGHGGACPWVPEERLVYFVLARNHDSANRRVLCFKWCNNIYSLRPILLVTYLNQR